MYSDRCPSRPGPPNPNQFYPNQLYPNPNQNPPCLNQHCSNPLCTNKHFQNPSYQNQNCQNQACPSQLYPKEPYPKEPYPKEPYPREPFQYPARNLCSQFQNNQLPSRTSTLYSNLFNRQSTACYPSQVYPQAFPPQAQQAPPPRKAAPHPLARCRLCNEEIPFTVGNPVELGFHMIDRHSSGSVVQYSIHEDEKMCPSRKASGGTNAGIPGVSSGLPTGLCPGSCRNAGEGAPGRRRQEWDDTVRKICSGGGGGRRRYKKKGKGLYKTTLETWTAGGCYMVCPTCKKEVKPLIRSQKNKVAYTSLGATFLLSCWPFCFLFPLHHKCSVDLYCPGCKQKLGVYDTTTGLYQANGNVVVRTENVPNISRSRH